MADLSITLRGFHEIPRVLGDFLGGYTLSGERGEPYRGRTQSVLKKSFLQNEKLEISISKINDSISALINEWGGAERIATAIRRFGVEFVHIEIHFCREEINELSGFQVENRILNLTSKIDSSLGISWSSN
ncbi:MAG: hypothetical protein LH610_08080 [Sphingomonas bacterium]|nr:hypothetical protein [Sphingomonas bacterium]